MQEQHEFSQTSGSITVHQHRKVRACSIASAHLRILTLLDETSAHTRSLTSCKLSSTSTFSVEASCERGVLSQGRSPVTRSSSITHRLPLLLDSTCDSFAKFNCIHLVTKELSAFKPSQLTHTTIEKTLLAPEKDVSWIRSGDGEWQYGHQEGS